MNDCKKKIISQKKYIIKPKQTQTYIPKFCSFFSIDKRLFEMYYVTTITTNTCSEIQEVVL